MKTMRNDYVIKANFQLKEEKSDLELNQKVLAEIFECYSKQVYNFMRYRVNNPHLAEELTSEVFEKIIRKYATYSPQKGKFEVWLFKIARNILNDYFRRQKIIRFLPLDDFMPSDLNPEEDVLVKERNSELVKALGVLNEKERMIISLKFAARLKNTEIAKIMNLSEKNTGVILCRSIKKLRNELNVD